MNYQNLQYGLINAKRGLRITENVIKGIATVLIQCAMPHNHDTGNMIAKGTWSHRKRIYPGLMGEAMADIDRGVMCLVRGADIRKWLKEFGVHRVETNFEDRTCEMYLTLNGVESKILIHTFDGDAASIEYPAAVSG